MEDWLRLIVVVVLSALGVLIWVTRWFTKHDSWAKGMDEFKSDTKTTLAEIRDDIKKILVALPKNVLAGTSPVQLTDLGKTVSKSVGAAAWAEKEASKLVGDVKGKTAYDVQDYCFKHMKECELAPDDDRVAKECAFQHGIKLEQVLDVFAVELRDRLLDIREDAS